MRSALVTGFVVLLLAGCGGGGGDSEPVAVGTGADRAWVLRPEGTPKMVAELLIGSK